MVVKGANGVTKAAVPTVNPEKTEQTTNLSRQASIVNAVATLQLDQAHSAEKSLTGRVVPKIKLSDEVLGKVYSQLESFLEEGAEATEFFKDEPALKGQDLIKWLTCPERKAAGKKPRVEERKVAGDVIQLAVSFRNSDQRGKFLSYIQQNFDAQNVELRGAGSTTVEAGFQGISKSSSIRFLAHGENLNKALNQSGYKPGRTFDARESKTVIISDADGTIWETPKSGESPMARSLANSPSKAGLINYLEEGGVLIVNSGNDSERVAAKVLMGIPAEKREALLPNVIVGGSGGNALFVYNKDGTVSEVEGYRDHVLELPTNVDPGNLDSIYLGDDERPAPKGNDWDGFKCVGFDHSICVSDKDVPTELQNAHIRGKEKVTGHIFNEVVRQRQASQEGRLFTPSNVSTLIQEVSKIVL